jgi:Calcineurin-like phosphoesterase
MKDATMTTYSALRAVSLIALSALAACASRLPQSPQSPQTLPSLDSPHSLTSALSPAPAGLVALYTVQGAQQQATVRAVSTQAACPSIAWDTAAELPMRLRAAPATEVVRGGGQTDSKAAVFEVRSCELEWPSGAKSARVMGQTLAAPHTVLERIVIVADTGCRMKASENAFQACNDAAKWPFAQIAQSAAALKPDLVLHIGDIHYRESPCPASLAGCAGSPWGYGFDAWQADFFAPAKPLLAAAPWVFVRGNHESCGRAGQGWFRFFDREPYSAARSCNDPALDDTADYTRPYAVPLAPDTQLIVFDSSKTSGKPFKSSDPAFARYSQDMQAVKNLTQLKPNSFFTSHHPLLAIAPADKTAATSQPKFGGNAGMFSVLESIDPKRLFPLGISTVLHGHMHLFESLSFNTAHPASLVLGNSGSAMEGKAPSTVPAQTELPTGAQIGAYAAYSEYGFATLDRVALADGVSGASGAGDSTSHWILTERDVRGQPVLTCELRAGKSRCQ